MGSRFPMRIGQSDVKGFAGEHYSAVMTRQIPRAIEQNFGI
jgi:hypothetical protein